MFEPAFIGPGASLLVTLRSALVLTVVSAVALLLPGVGSVVVDAPVTVLEIIEALAALALTFTTSVQLAVSALARLGLVKVIVPVPPTGTESVRVQPAGVVTETNVVLAGSGSEILALRAEFGPLLVNPIV